jgi:actin-related protein
VAIGKFPTMWAGLALKRGTLPSILSQRIIDRMESRSRSESPHTVFVNSAPIFRGTFGGSLLERISRTGQFGTSVDPRIEWENIE